MQKLHYRKLLRYIIPVIIAVLVYLSLSTISGEAGKPIKLETEKLNTSRIIFDFYRNGGLIVYPSSYNSKRFEEFANRISSRFRSSQLKVVSDTALTKKELENSNIILLGTYRSNKILQLFSDKLPAKFTDGKFSLLGKTYNKPSDLIDFIYPNPLNHNKGLMIVSGNSDSLIANNFRLNFSGNLRIKDGYETLLIANFVEGAGNKWEIDKENLRDFENLRDTILVTKNYTYITHSPQINKIEVKAIAALNENSIDTLQNIFGNNFKPVHINYNLYNTFEDKGLIIHNTGISNFDSTNESVHSVVNDYIRGDDFTQDAILLLRKNFGAPKLKFLETGMSLYLARNWRGLDYKFWASKLFISNNVPPLNELLDNEMTESESYLLAQPLAGAFAGFLIQKFGINKLMKLYPKWNPVKPEINELDTEWRNYLATLSESYKENLREERKNFPKDVPEFLKGFSYAHVGYDIYNGYLSRESFNSLKQLKVIGVNSISIMPFTSIRNPNEPEPLSFWQSAFAENDESLIFLQEAAVKLNFVVMLKPHIWLRRGWPGDIKMNTKADWDQFFKDYYNWIRHYALLAEMYKMPILCIGNELAQATIGHEDKWIEMVDKIRKLYSGKITYGANWDNEFEKLSFWNIFDYIGISQYYPLSKKDNPTDAELQAGADSVINRIEDIQNKFNVPVLFTEIGYKSSMGPWKTALEKDPQPDSTFNNQSRCYEALFKAAYGKKWLAGMFWWKWPSYLGYGDFPERDLYVPLNKPAENVVNMWYSKEWN